MAEKFSLDLLNIVFILSSLIKEAASCLLYRGVFIGRTMGGVFEDVVAYQHLRIISFPRDEA